MGHLRTKCINSQVNPNLGQYKKNSVNEDDAGKLCNLSRSNYICSRFGDPAMNLSLSHLEKSRNTKRSITLPKILNQAQEATVYFAVVAVHSLLAGTTPGPTESNKMVTYRAIPTRALVHRVLAYFVL